MVGCSLVLPIRLSVSRPKVTLVDISQDVLDKSQARIGESVKRVAKKQFKEDQEAAQKGAG